VCAQLEKIVRDAKQFVAVMLVIIAAFAHVFYVRLASSDSREFGSGYQTCITLYFLAFTGEFEHDALPNWFDKNMAVAFVLIIVVVMLNVLIAIVSDSYDEAMVSVVVISIPRKSMRSMSTQRYVGCRLHRRQPRSSFGAHATNSSYKSKRGLRAGL
jgi:F0F1-type ATP synthase membrane subunit a